MIGRLFQLSLVLVAIGCNGETRESANSSPRTLRVATTTSTRDSGLMELLIPVFEKQFNARVKLIAVGSGKALKLGELGEVDVIVVHAEAAELQFLDDKHAVRRERFMFNYFELLGPRSDPAKVKGLDPTSAFREIQKSKSVFVSRGDESGTHQREQQFWGNARLSPDWDNYLETGQGMGASLLIASQKQGYILCDRGTYLAMKDKIDLIPLAPQSAELKNPYGVLCINPEKHRNINAKLAEGFADFLIAPETQKLIEEFTRDGDPLFFPLHPVN